MSIPGVWQCIDNHRGDHERLAVVREVRETRVLMLWIDTQATFWRSMYRFNKTFRAHSDAAKSWRPRGQEKPCTQSIPSVPSAPASALSSSAGSSSPARASNGRRIP